MCRLCGRFVAADDDISICVYPWGQAHRAAIVHDVCSEPRMATASEMADCSGPTDLSRPQQSMGLRPGGWATSGADHAYLLTQVSGVSLGAQRPAVAPELAPFLVAGFVSMARYDLSDVPFVAGGMKLVLTGSDDPKPFCVSYSLLGPCGGSDQGIWLSGPPRFYLPGSFDLAMDDGCIAVFVASGYAGDIRELNLDSVVNNSDVVAALVPLEATGLHSLATAKKMRRKSK